MATVRSRRYEGEADYERIRRLLVESYAISGPPDYCTIGDLDWWRYTGANPDEIRSSRLWLDADERAVGFAWPLGDTVVDMVSHPRYRSLEAAMLDWAENHRRASAGDDVAGRLTIYSFDTDTKRIALLRERGYEPGDGYHLNYYHRRIDGPLDEPLLPEGYSIRNVQGEDDLEQRVAVHRDAFAPSKMTVEKHRAVMASPTYRPELDLIAVAPDGPFAAFCIVWYDAENRNGVFEPVGCHSAHQRRGLARAVMQEGLRRLRALGGETAVVLSDVKSAAANGLYRAMGFTLLDCNAPWQKNLRRTE